MTAQRPTHIAISTPQDMHAPAVSSPRRSPRPPHRFSHSSKQRAHNGDNDSELYTGKPAIPNPGGMGSSTPLPSLSMIVLSIALLGEFLSANVSTPFLYNMVEGFGKLEDSASVAYWTGVLVSVFFVTQFLTSLLWATVADKHGKRVVLFISLLGSALTCATFGMSKSLEQAITIRLLQGVFAGAIGVARSTVTLITDTTNEGRAYAILGFCWGLGGVSGAVIGGSFESPAKKWPGLFPGGSVFVVYPYLLPCLLAGSVTLTGALLSLFLSRDGGPRRGAIFLTPEKGPNNDNTIPVSTQIPTSSAQGVSRRISNKLSGYFARRVYDVEDGNYESRTELRAANASPGDSRTHRASRPATGSAYDYGAFRSRLGSRVSFASNVRRASMVPSARRVRRDTGADPDLDTPNVPEPDLNLAQRILMANEFTVTSMADLWVNAAITADEDPFESDSELSDIGESNQEHEDFFREESPVLSSLPDNTRPKLSRPRNESARHSRTTLGGRKAVRLPGISDPENTTPPLERGRRRSSNILPLIYGNTGVRGPEHTPPNFELHDSEALIDTLAPIEEGAQTINQRSPMLIEAEQRPSVWRQLPVAIIVQYGLLALHSTTHDQVFLLYLVSPYETGGLGLNAAHFAQLIALMCLAQIAYQFYLYPYIGPPRGRFSHLAMFRIGSALFIPAYLTVILYRSFTGPGDNGNTVVMALLSLSTAVRYCGSTFAYTAVAILLNYMSPPEVNGLANGIAQSIVSLARFVGPVVGGYLWSVSVENGSGGYPLGFLVVSAVTSIAIAHSFFIR